MSRQALAADQSGPPKSPAVRITYFRFSHALLILLSTFPSIKQVCATGQITLTYARSFLIVGNDNFLVLLIQKNLEITTFSSTRMKKLCSNPFQNFSYSL